MPVAARNGESSAAVLLVAKISGMPQALIRSRAGRAASKTVAVVIEERSVEIGENDHAVWPTRFHSLQ
jgi:hypothetical protein